MSFPPLCFAADQQQIVGNGCVRLGAQQQAGQQQAEGGEQQCGTEKHVEEYIGFPEGDQAPEGGAGDATPEAFEKADANFQ
jgi:hypothetical protein